MNKIALSADAAYVRALLGMLASDGAIAIPEYKYWNRGLDELIAHGLAERVDGYAALTMKGRDSLYIDKPKLVRLTTCPGCGARKLDHICPKCGSWS